MSRIKIELDLSQRGAEALLNLIGKASGATGPAGVMREIFNALVDEIGPLNESFLYVNEGTIVDMKRAWPGEDEPDCLAKVTTCKP